jgi:hypothetical protein
MTEYVVLYQLESGDWSEVKSVEARSSRAAIRVVVDGAASLDNRYVAVPVRSWQPVTAKIETRTQLKFQ